MSEQKYIENLKELGLSQNQALVYFELLKNGSKGCIVRDLDHVLEIGRTNIYPVLRDLIEFGCVEEAGEAEKSKNATIYVAVEPDLFIEKVIEKEKEKITKLISIKKKYSKTLRKIFDKGVEVELNEVESHLQNYLEPLLRKGWKIKSYVKREVLEMFNYTVYDCMLLAPHAQYLKDCSFHLFVFNYNIENDVNALSFFSKGLKRKTEEMKSYFFDIKQFKLEEGKVYFNGKNHLSFTMKVKIEDLIDSDYFDVIEEDIREKIKDDNNQYYEVGKALIIPQEEKIFYLWGETVEILKEMIFPILF
ncbi:MAG: hypothetical protein GF383_03175 [Candidatus Lokiarchaeota archaeon]|nr:hypothetical protein [Candidatus Lokiarchaeota archaeon]MBD3338605.1 hypothetical protein [Candidatus Lokiarchaeota archaeon]